MIKNNLKTIDMDAVHLHLILNHIPVIITALSLFLLILVMISDNSSYRRLAFLGFVFAALFAFLTYETGENAEDIVENLTGFSEEVIEDHEHAAENARWLSILLGVAGITGLIFFNSDTAKGYKVFMYVLLVLSLVVIGYLAYTGYLGGLIRHTELQDLF